MPANIPSPIVGGGGGGQRQNPIQALLLGLIGQAGSMGLQRLFQQTPPPSAGQRQRTAQEGAATGALAQREGTPERSALQMLSEMGIGDATVSTESLSGGLQARQALTADAPERLALQQQQDEIAAANLEAQKVVESMERSISRLRADPDADEEDVTRLEQTFDLIQAGMAPSDAAREAATLDKPSLQDQLEDQRTMIALSVLSGDVPTEALFNLATENVTAALAVQELGLMSMYNSFRSRDTSAANSLRNTAIAFRTQHGITRVPIQGIEHYLTTGNARNDTEAALLQPHFDDLNQRRAVARLGMISNVMQTPAARVTLEAMKVHLEAGDGDRARDQYNRLRSLAFSTPGIDRETAAIAFPDVGIARVPSWFLPKSLEEQQFNFLTLPEERGAQGYLTRDITIGGETFNANGDPTEAIRIAIRVRNALATDDPLRNDITAAIGVLRQIAAGNIK